MISLFRSFNPLVLVLLIVLAVLLRIGIILNPPEDLHFTLFESLASVLFNLDSDGMLSVQQNIFLALTVTIIQAVLFNRVVNEYNLYGKPTFLPSLMYVTCSSLLGHFLVLTPALLCNFLLIWMLDRFLSVHRKESAMATMYDAGLLIGLGTLMYVPFVAMMLLLWICLIIFRPFNWREWVVGFIGFLTVYFFIGVAYYWTDAFEKFRAYEVPLAIEFKVLDINKFNYLMLIPLLVIIFLSIISLQQKLYRTYVHIRKSYLMLFFTLIFSLLSFFITPKYQLSHFLLVVPAASVFMGFYFMSATKRWFFEGIYALLIICIIYSQLA